MKKVVNNVVLLVIVIMIIVCVPTIRGCIIGGITSTTSRDVNVSVAINRIHLTFPLSLLIRSILIYRRKSAVTGINHIRITITL